MSVYKLELEKASIIIKKETIINPPPVIETVDIPNGTTFGWSNFKTNPEAIYLLSNYINTGTYNGSLFYYATFPPSNSTLPTKPFEFTIANGNNTFGGLNNYLIDQSYPITVDCSRIDRLRYTFASAYITKVNLKNTENIYSMHRIVDSASRVNEILGIDASGCKEIDFNENPDVTCYLEINNLGKNPELTTCVFYGNRYALSGLVYSCVTNSFDRAAAGYEPCVLQLRYTPKLTDEQIAKATSKGYTITT